MGKKASPGRLEAEGPAGGRRFSKVTLGGKVQASKVGIVEPTGGYDKFRGLTAATGIKAQPKGSSCRCRPICDPSMAQVRVPGEGLSEAHTMAVQIEEVMRPSKVSGEQNFEL